MKAKYLSLLNGYNYIISKMCLLKTEVYRRETHSYKVVVDKQETHLRYYIFIR